jgi:hypothetical protein
MSYGVFLRRPVATCNSALLAWLERGLASMINAIEKGETLIELA